MCISGSCSNPGLPGDDCDVGEDSDCVSGNCVDSTCECLVDADCTPLEPAYVCNSALSFCIYPKSFGGACAEDADCEAGLVCDLLTETCAECVINSDCGSGTCLDGICLNAGQPFRQPCIETDDCEAGLTCEGNLCLECVDNIDCGSDICYFGICLVVPDAHKRCDETADCEGAEVCTSCKVCSPASCLVDSECLPGTCLFGVCEPLSLEGQPCDSTDDCDTGLECALNVCR